MEDRISSLPEFILEHILSYLPFKEAVRSSALAKQWKHHWAFLPNLDVDQYVICGDSYQEKDKLGNKVFMDFVDRLLRIRGAVNLTGFRLSCSRFCDKSRIDSWMHSVAQLHVKELDLSPALGLGPCLGVSKRFAECQSLKVLKLNHIQFPRDFNGDLFSSYFPWLESVSLDKCVMPRMLNISCPLLKTFYIGDDIYPTLEHLTITAKELEILRLCLWIGSSFRISAPKLRSFDWVQCYACDVSLENVTSVSKADISLDADKSIPVNYNLLLQLLCSLSNVTFLKLCEVCFEVFTAKQNLQKPLPMFGRVKNLQVKVVLCKEAIYVIGRLLDKCSNLKSLFVSSYWNRHCRRDQSFQIDDQLSFNCSLNHLKTVVIDHFGANDDEFMFSECLLKNAAVLEELVVRLFVRKSNQIVSEIKKKLLEFPMASSSVEISII